MTLKQSLVEAWVLQDMKLFVSEQAVYVFKEELHVKHILCYCFAWKNDIIFSKLQIKILQYFVECHDPPFSTRYSSIVLSMDDWVSSWDHWLTFEHYYSQSGYRILYLMVQINQSYGTKSCNPIGYPSVNKYRQ